MTALLKVFFIGYMSFAAPEISVKQFAEHLEQGKKFNILDARELEEYLVSHLKGATLVGYRSFDIEKTLKAIDSTKPTVVYCSAGYRSDKIANKLLERNIRALNLKGGLFEWFNSGRPVYKDHELVNSIHGYSRSWSKKVKRKGQVVIPKKKTWWPF